jgi:polyphosphate kinase 2 (PPK2 family)
MVESKNQWYHQQVLPKTFPMNGHVMFGDRSHHNKSLKSQHQAVENTSSIFNSTTRQDLNEQNSRRFAYELEGNYVWK